MFSTEDLHPERSATSDEHYSWWVTLNQYRGGPLSLWDGDQLVATGAVEFRIVAKLLRSLASEETPGDFDLGQINFAEVKGLYPGRDEDEGGPDFRLEFMVDRTARGELWISFRLHEELLAACGGKELLALAGHFEHLANMVDHEEIDLRDVDDEYQFEGREAA